MYASIREYTLQPGKVDELVAKIRNEFVPMLDKAPGFVGYTVVQVGVDDIVTTTVYESQAGAENSVKLAAGWVKDALAAYVTAPPRVTTGEMPVRFVKEGVIARFGVMRRYEIKQADVAKLCTRLHERLVPILNDMPGFASYGLLVESGQNRGLTLAAYIDRASAEAAWAQASKWTEENLSDISAKPLDVVMGDIKLRHMATALAHSVGTHPA